MSDVPMYDTAGYQSFVHQLDPRIRPLRCTKEHLEGRKHTIIRFTTQFYKNNEQLGQSITRSVVEFFWIDEIWRLYPTDHPEKRRLIGQDTYAQQAHSPKYEVYWQKRLDAEAFKAKRARQSSAEFWSFPRQLSNEEQKDKGVVLLGNHDWEYILPEVQLMPLYHVFFLELAKKVKAANPGKSLTIELMRRLWRLLIREVYDFVNEAEITAKTEEAKAVTDDEFEEAMRVVPETLSKKRGISAESDTKADPSESQSQQSKKKRTVRLAETDGSGSQTGANKSEPESSTGPKSSAVTNGHQPVNNTESPVRDPKILELTRRNTELTADLATAERQVAEHSRAKESADRRWSSQHGQLQAAERDARELRKARPDLAYHMKARKDAEQQLKSQHSELKKAKGKAAELERELRTEKGRVARLEASLAKAGVGSGGEKITEAGGMAFYV
ncbi:hypothetical protein HO133_001832 [Letharia lupina]|uniref:Uncharacterized protein n=1 Tax=Letharia lupina TaxID=560253 RepID=A0A8H6CEB6_9LECA|nr:uncharacterized protein HO133_001832 [Letharia lupina]KAF6221864.1 hypothetical protein HO133_001832 [Letharia lupina]